MKYYIILFVISAIVYTYMVFSSKCAKGIEGLNEGTAHYCNNCDELTFGQCLECYNCGFCGKGGSGKCMRGTFTGPNNKELERTCPRWYHNDQFWRYINGTGDSKCIDRAFEE